MRFTFETIKEADISSLLWRY